MYIYVNHEVVDEQEARISPMDHGFLYGMGLFETFRTYNGHPFLLDDHFTRLAEGADELGIALPDYDREAVVAVIRSLLEANGMEDAYFRWNISAGKAGVGLMVAPYTAPETMVFVKQLQEPPKEKEARLLQTVRNTPEGAVRRKSHHYLNNILGKRELANQPDVEGVFLTQEGFLSEGVVSNLFWVKEDTLFTPSLVTGCLPGITRAWVIKAAEAEGFRVIEGEFTPDHLLEAETVFVCNAIQELVRVSAWEGKSIASDNQHLFDSLKERYHQNKWHAFAISACC
ncbi:aminodeoxychorismate lyase [Salisediminibacterium beveridgei]|uniref:Aminodeoxychorismate lyase n=1 Tax=Salisediminibacterium beveridgei TaxID=632773 RepID=A0A1D7R012_9BACI|nr:aminodeoxychorismate lyase [Salisediminibacterium beveridgei]AOM84604.1 Aminodeoxychorismate lyase [Salisediminibacterium beveridgei]